MAIVISISASYTNIISRGCFPNDGQKYKPKAGGAKHIARYRIIRLVIFRVGNNIGQTA